MKTRAPSQNDTSSNHDRHIAHTSEESPRAWEYYIFNNIAQCMSSHRRGTGACRNLSIAKHVSKTRLLFKAPQFQQHYTSNGILLFSWNHTTWVKTNTVKVTLFVRFFYSRIYCPGREFTKKYLGYIFVWISPETHEAQIYENYR